MSISEKISSYKYEKRKRKQEKNLEKFNQRQEILNNKYKDEKQKSDFKSLLSRLKFETYTKRLVGIIVFISLIDLQLSYVLAFMGKSQIAETLSIQVCTTILGTTLVYIIRAYFDTKAEKKDEMIRSGIVMDKNTHIISDDVLKDKLQELIDNSGIVEHINTNNLVQPENPEDSNLDISDE